jgi:hypothetical protein
MRDLSEAQNPDLRASFAALQRAAQLARKIAIQTGTDLIVVKDGKLTRIPPHVLRQTITDASDDGREGAIPDSTGHAI